MSIIIGVFRNRIKAELSDFRFFFSGLAELRIPSWVLLFPVVAVNSFPGAGGRILPFTALVAKQFKV